METIRKSAQEMSGDGDVPPSRYIVKKESIFGSIDPSLPSLPIPLIDVTLLLSGAGDELQNFRAALSSWGCFQAIGHGIPETYLDEVREAAKQFFALPVEEKKKYSRGPNNGEGWGGDSIVSDEQVLDWSDRLVLKVLPVDQRRLDLWPQNPPAFREILDEYPRKIKGIIEVLFKAIAKSLNLEENCFVDQFGDRARFFTRFNFYPPCPRPDQVLGLKPHSDKSGITVLLQDKEMEGLHVLKGGQWFRMPIVPYALVVNVGDQMQIMSNGIIKSPVHRVVTNPEKQRISITVSNEPELEKEIGPADGLVDEKRPCLYRKVKNYAAINFEYFQKGQVAIDTIRI